MSLKRTNGFGRREDCRDYPERREKEQVCAFITQNITLLILMQIYSASFLVLNIYNLVPRHRTFLGHFLIKSRLHM